MQRIFVNGFENMIYMNLAHMSGREKDFVNEAFDTNWVVPLGPNVNGFEEDLERYMHEVNANVANNQVLNEKRVAALSSGTASVHLGLIDVGVKAGDEVICQSLTFCASVNPVIYLGAKPVLIDSEPETYNMDPELLEQAIQDRMANTGKKPKAIVLVHLYGMPAKVDKIMSIASKYDIPVMEDAAEALGSTFDNQLCGTFGQYGVWSFNGNKMITTSGGGALICPNAESKKNAIFFATQAKEPIPYYQHENVGFNYRLSNICAGIGRGQMTILREHIEHHRMLHEVYVREFAEVAGVSVHSAIDERMNPNYWLTTILIDPSVTITDENLRNVHSIQSSGGQPNDNVEQLRLLLLQNEIESRPLWKPLHCMPAYSAYARFVNGTSESLFRKGLCLPSGPHVSVDEAIKIAELIKKGSHADA